MEKLFIITAGVIILFIVPYIIAIYSAKLSNNTKNINEVKNGENIHEVNRKFDIGKYYKFHEPDNPFNVTDYQKLIYILDIKPNSNQEIYVQYCYCHFDYTKKCFVINRHTVFSDQESRLIKNYIPCDIEDAALIMMKLSCND